MDNFNYQEYLKNNPLLKPEVKEEKLLTESQEVEELAVDRTGKDKPSRGSFRKGQYGIGDAVLDLFKKLKKENLSEDKYDDLVAGDKDIPADKKADAAKALRMLDKGASYEKVKHLLEDEEITEEEVTEEVAEEVTEESSSKMKVSELKAKIREDIISLLQEAEEDVDVDVEDDVEADVDVDVKDTVDVDAEGDDVEIEKKSVKADIEVGLSPEEELVQDSLEAAMKASQELGNQTLTDQIGNTITYFTRQFVVGGRTD